MSKEHVKNPLTGRIIQVGGAVWRRPVNDGLMDNQPAKNELFQADTKAEALVAKKLLTKQNTDKSRSVKIHPNGRTVIKCRKRLSQKEISQGMGAASAIVLKKIKAGELTVPEGASDDDVHQYIQEQVLLQIMKLSGSVVLPEKSGYKLETPCPSEDEEYSDEGDEGDE